MACTQLTGETILHGEVCFDEYMRDLKMSLLDLDRRDFSLILLSLTMAAILIWWMLCG